MARVGASLASGANIANIVRAAQGVEGIEPIVREDTARRTCRQLQRQHDVRRVERVEQHFGRVPHLALALVDIAVCQAVGVDVVQDNEPSVQENMGGGSDSPLTQMRPYVVKVCDRAADLSRGSFPAIHEATTFERTRQKA